MRNWLILVLISSIVVGCGCNRKEEKKVKKKENIQQKNLPAPGFEKNYENSNSGLPRPQIDLSKNDTCLELGESAQQAGELPIKDLKRKCCKGLVDRTSVDVCGKGIAGGYIYSCIKCGDGTCDRNNESKCNCPEDCK
ncbi:MAG: hypothetical protein CME65_10815 [Halobacteriovoraceae bacterium]|nr:hypothetical protein [Halobacteriovoraceae bacterium]